MTFINKNIKNLENLGKQKNIEYTQAKPFPHIVIDNLFDNDLLDKIRPNYNHLLFLGI